MTVSQKYRSLLIKFRLKNHAGMIVETCFSCGNRCLDALIIILVPLCYHGFLKKLYFSSLPFFAFPLIFPLLPDFLTPTSMTPAPLFWLFVLCLENSWPWTSDVSASQMLLMLGLQTCVNHVEFYVVVGTEPKASCMPGRHSLLWCTPHPENCAVFILILVCFSLGLLIWCWLAAVWC